MKDQLAVQMFTLREHTTTASTFAHALREVARIGYPAVQLSAIGAMKGPQPEVSAKTARKMLDDCGLRCIATHRPWHQLLNETSAEIDFHAELGCDFTAIGGFWERDQWTEAGFARFLAQASDLIEQLNRAGLRFGYHNHSHEFGRPNGAARSLFEILRDESPRGFLFELDLYWIEHAGIDSVRLLEPLSGRVPVVHLKDKEVDLAEGPRMAPIGEGNHDWHRILPACQRAGVEWYAVEQDHCYRDPFDCLRASFDFLAQFETAAYRDPR